MRRMTGLLRILMGTLMLSWLVAEAHARDEGVPTPTDVDPYLICFAGDTHTTVTDDVLTAIAAYATLLDDRPNPRLLDLAARAARARALSGMAQVTGGVRVNVYSGPDPLATEHSEATSDVEIISSTAEQVIRGARLTGTRWVVLDANSICVLFHFEWPLDGPAGP